MNWDAKKRKAQINALPERIGAKQKRLLDAGGLFCFRHHHRRDRRDRFRKHRPAPSTGLRQAQAAQSALATAGIGALYEGTQAAGIPVSPVDAAISQVSVNVRELQATIQRLRARLEPVLMPNDPIGQGSQTNPVPAPPAPLVGHIEDLSGQLRESCAALQDLERRLAL